MHARGIRKRTDGYDPGESRILLNIARALNFLPIKPPASLPAFSSSTLSASLSPSRSSCSRALIHPVSLICNPFPRPCAPPTNPSLRPSNLIRSLPARFPGRIGYSVTAHEHRLISIPATQLPPTPTPWPPLDFPSSILHPSHRSRARSLARCFSALSTPTIETSTDPRRCRATCGKSLAESPDSARFKSLLSASAFLSPPAPRRPSASRPCFFSE